MNRRTRRRSSPARSVALALGLVLLAFGSSCPGCGSDPEPPAGESRSASAFTGQALEASGELAGGHDLASSGARPLQPPGGIAGLSAQAPGLGVAALKAATGFFEPVSNQHSPARFILRGRRAAAFFVDSGFALALQGAEHRASGLHVSLPGARRVAPRTEAELPGRVHSYVGPEENWRTNVPTYARLVYDDVWPGIDLVVEPAPRGFAYRFEVAPGADERAIRMRWRGADNVAVQGRALAIATGAGVLRESGLRCLEGKREIECGYAPRGAGDAWDVAFSVPGRDRGAALVIDPVIEWSSFLGGSNQDQGYAIAADSGGNAYLTGYTISTDFPSAGGFDAALGGAEDAFVTRVTAAGTRAWSSYLGGSGIDRGRGVAADAAGAVYVTGETSSSDFPSAGGFDASLTGASDAFVTKLTASGTLAWSSYLGGAAEEEGDAIAVDANGNVFVTGYTASSDFPSSGGFDSTLGGARDAFVTKIGGSGSILWSSFLGGSSADAGNAVAVDGAGNVYLTGYTRSSLQFPVTGGFDTSFGGVDDAFVTKVTAAGALVWSSYLGGGGEDQGTAIAVDRAGNVFVTGYTASSDFPSAGGFDATLAGTSDGFLTKVTAAGALAWSTYLGGSVADWAYAVAVDSTGSAYVAGATESTDFPSSGGFDSALGGTSDGFVTKIAPSGSGISWSTYLGGSGVDACLALALAGATVYAAGSTQSSDFPKAGGFDTILGGTHDAFVTRINAASFGALNVGRVYHTATLLPSGKILVAGGGNAGGYLASAELYDPATGTFSPTAGPMGAARYEHTATLLRSGKVLFVGGWNLASAEIYDPASGTFSATTAPTSRVRSAHTATLLPSGKVLIVGGVDGSGTPLTLAELYDPVAGTFSPADSLDTGRGNHTATLLASGKVLIAGGGRVNVSYTATAEIYDPDAGTAGTFSPTTGPLALARLAHSATLLSSGKVLIAGGVKSGGGVVASGELYDPLADTFSDTTGPLATARAFPGATLLPSGKVLFTAGNTNGGCSAAVDLYDPLAGSFSTLAPIATGRCTPTATLLPSGRVLVVGGEGPPNTYLASAELYDPQVGSFAETTGPLATARYRHTVTLLPTGKVLVAGGIGGGSSAELFDPAAGTFSPTTGSLGSARRYHTATLLASGKVLLAAGEISNGSYLATAVLYDPAAATFSPTTGTLGAARAEHTATLLPSGKVLIAGGLDSLSTGGPLESAELFDPAAGTFTPTAAPLGTARYYHTATLLPSGKVLIAGGFLSSHLASAELYDPEAGTFSPTAGPLGTGRFEHSATLLPNGKVLIAGGRTTSVGALAPAELYDPVTGAFAPTTGPLGTARTLHTATLLPGGKVLVTGGYNLGHLASAELYDPAAGTFSPVPVTLSTGRAYQRATLLPNGKVLIVAGYGIFSGSSTNLASAELYDEGRGASTAWTPSLTGPLAPLPPGGILNFTGALFTGISEGSSGGTRSSPANFPLLLLRRQDNEAVAFADVKNWTATSASAELPASLQPGWHWATVIVNGVPSSAQPLLVSAPIGASCLTSDDCASGHCADGLCCATACGACGTCATGSCVARIEGTLCRAAAGDCDAAESCDGSNSDCPADARKASDTACASDANPCTRDVCDGAQVTCQHPAANAGTICRAAAGECDIEEQCSGSNSSCPTDGFSDSGVVCRAAAGDCDNAEACDGSTSACPADAREDSDSACTDDANPCTRDVCDGVQIACQHLAGNAGALCRAAAGACDVEEECSGDSASCPADGFSDLGVVCRPAAGECDVAEACEGSTAACPADALKSIDAACADDGDPCTRDACDGALATCQHPAGNAGTCRADVGADAPLEAYDVNGFSCGCGSGGGSSAWLAVLGVVLHLGRRARRRARPVHANALVSLLAVLVAALVTTDAAAAPKPKVALLGITPGEGIPVKTAALLEELLLNALERTRRFSLIGRSDIANLLGFEVQKQAMGCGDNSSCIAELAGAMGVEYVATASVGRLGASSVLSVKIIDATKVKVMARANRSAKTDDALAEGMDGLAAELVDLCVEAGVLRAPEKLGGAQAPSVLPWPEKESIARPAPAPPPPVEASVAPVAAPPPPPIPPVAAPPHAPPDLPPSATPPATGGTRLGLSMALVGDPLHGRAGGEVSLVLGAEDGWGFELGATVAKSPAGRLALLHESWRAGELRFAWMLRLLGTVAGGKTVVGGGPGLRARWPLASWLDVQGTTAFEGYLTDSARSYTLLVGLGVVGHL